MKLIEYHPASEWDHDYDPKLPSDLCRVCKEPHIEYVIELNT